MDYGLISARAQSVYDRFRDVLRFSSIGVYNAWFTWPSCLTSRPTVSWGWSNHCFHTHDPCAVYCPMTTSCHDTVLSSYLCAGRLLFGVNVLFIVAVFMITATVVCFALQWYICNDIPLPRRNTYSRAIWFARGRFIHLHSIRAFYPSLITYTICYAPRYHIY